MTAMSNFICPVYTLLLKRQHKLLKIYFFDENIDIQSNIWQKSKFVNELVDFFMRCNFNSYNTDNIFPFLKLNVKNTTLQLKMARSNKIRK